MEIAAILIAVITLIASLSIPEIRQKLRFDPKSEQLSPLGHPLFRGHLRSPVDSKSFSDFLDKNIGGIVFIDVSIDEKDFVGQLEGDLQWFALSEEIFEPLQGGDKPTSMNSIGTSYNVLQVTGDNDSFFIWHRGFYKLHGYFTVVHFIGPNQGYMSCNFRAVKVENAGKRA